MEHISEHHQLYQPILFVYRVNFNQIQPQDTQTHIYTLTYIHIKKFKETTITITNVKFGKLFNNNDNNDNNNNNN